MKEQQKIHVREFTFFTMYLLFSGSSANRMVKYTVEDSVQAICEAGGQFIKMQYRE